MLTINTQEVRVSHGAGGMLGTLVAGNGQMPSWDDEHEILALLNHEHIKADKQGE